MIVEGMIVLETCRTYHNLDNLGCVTCSLLYLNPVNKYAMSSVSYKIYLFSVETGLEGLLFTMLNSETDAKMLSNIHDTLISMLHELVMENLAGWLTLCKAVLSASTGTIQTMHVIRTTLHQDNSPPYMYWSL